MRPAPVATDTLTLSAAITAAASAVLGLVTGADFFLYVSATALCVAGASFVASIRSR
jgi:hypothetical protein